MKANSEPGPGVDAQGRAVIDPTANVIANLDAAVKRQDDLRHMESDHVREIMSLRADYDEMLRDAESKRIDAIRAVDVGAVNRAAEVAATQAATLAAQVATSAETLRNQVAAAATAQTVALAAALEPVQKDIADLRRAQYEALGSRATVTESRGTNQWVVGILVVAAFSVLSLLVATAAVVTALIGG